MLSFSALKWLKYFPWSILFILIGFMVLSSILLYSAANLSLYPWAMPQLMRFLLGFVLMIVISVIDIKFWLNTANILYVFSFLLLLVVEVFGFVGMGAQRWINLGFFNIQPSELMKISLILSIARYFHYKSLSDLSKIKTFFVPIFLILAPVLLVLKQPDLGTAIMLSMVGFFMIFTAGISWRYLLAGFSGFCLFLPLGWTFLKTYQKNRILTFLNPENDPLGTGYHIIQSKIALGSGGFWGRGFSLGTQSQLNFLPEKQTDFIFAMFGEEFGFIGTLLLLSAYFLLILYGFRVVLYNSFVFSKFTALGITCSLFLYVFVNISMVMGLLPVVGIPLPFISYGGTALITLLIGMGLLIACDMQRYRKKSTL